MAKIDLQPIEARARATTPGPWIVRVAHDKRGWPVLRLQDTVNRTTSEVELNALFVASAREDIYALIAEVKGLRDLLNGLRPYLDEYTEKVFRNQINERLTPPA